MANKPKAKPDDIKPFWDVKNRKGRLIVRRIPQGLSFSVWPATKRAVISQAVHVEGKGLRALHKDMASGGVLGARVKCAEAPDHRYCYASMIAGDERAAGSFTIVDKVRKNETLTWTVFLGPQAWTRLTNLLRETMALSRRRQE